MMSCDRRNIRVVNALWQTRIPFTFGCPSTQDYFTKLTQVIDGADVWSCKQLSETKVSLARPCMLIWKWNCHHLQRRVTILFFPNRSIQFLGVVTEDVIYHLYCHCTTLFQQHLPFPRLKTMTVVYCFNGSIVNFHTLFNSSHAHCVYETDLFPGAQLTYWTPLHVVLFHTGKMTISGVKSFSQVDAIVNDLLTNRYFPLSIK